MFPLHLQLQRRSATLGLILETRATRYNRIGIFRLSDPLFHPVSNVTKMSICLSRCTLHREKIRITSILKRITFCEYRDMLRKESIIIATVIRIFAYLYAVKNENTVADKALVFYFFIFTNRLRCYYYWYYSCHLPTNVHIHIEDTDNKVLFRAGTAQLRPSANCFRARSYLKNNRLYLRCAHTSATYTTHLNIHSRIYLLS